MTEQTQTTPMTLEETVRQLHEARQELTKVDTERLQKELAFRAENAGVYLHLAATQRVVADLEAKTRELGVAAYNITGKRQPTPGIEVKLTTSIEYNAASALEWAKEHKLALKLDTAAFEKLVKTGTAVTPFVTVHVDVPRVYIASDLGKALEASKPAEGS